MQASEILNFIFFFDDVDNSHEETIVVLGGTQSTRPETKSARWCWFGRRIQSAAPAKLH